MTVYLRAPDRPTLLDALREAGLTTVDEDGTEHPVTTSHSHFIDVIGEITRTITPAEYDEEGNETSPAVTETLPGCHANWRGPVPEALQPYVIDKPNNPSQVIA